MKSEEMFTDLSDEEFNKIVTDTMLKKNCLKMNDSEFRRLLPEYRKLKKMEKLIFDPGNQ